MLFSAGSDSVGKTVSRLEWRAVSSFHFVEILLKSKVVPYSITSVGHARSWFRFLGSQLARDISYKPGGRLSLLSTRPAITFPAKIPAWKTIIIVVRVSSWVILRVVLLLLSDTKSVQESHILISRSFELLPLSACKQDYPESRGRIFVKFLELVVRPWDKKQQITFWG